MKRVKTITLAAVAACGTLGVLAGGTTAAPSKETASAAYTGAPYLVGMQGGTEIKQILTVGDTVPKTGGSGTYRMVGIPDGLGAYDNGDGTFSVLMNHEITDAQGVIRAHGAIGSFVSKWVVKKDDKTVVSGADLITTVNTYANGSWAVTPGVKISRLCSADLPALSAFWNESTKLGYNGRLFMNGEEKGDEGRAFASELNGTTWELPHLGKFSWENSVANPSTGDKTVVIGTDDSTPGQVYVYVGTKRAAGNTVEKAGLAGGKLYGIKAGTITAESATTGVPTSTLFTMHDHGDVSKLTGKELQAASTTAGVTNWLRPEDVAWDPNNPNVAYFVTSDRFPGRSRLYALIFKDINNPALGGAVEQVFDGGKRGPQMMDNIGIDKAGRIMIQEDIGNQRWRGKIWLYNIQKKKLRNVAEFNDTLFNPDNKVGHLGQDEESSGSIDLTDILGAGWWGVVTQIHAPNGDAETVESGALHLMYLPLSK